MNASLNIVVACPTRVGTAKVGINLGAALSRLGHRVSYYDYDKKPPVALLPRALRPRDWPERYRRYASEQLLRLVRDTKPDLFLCVKGIQLYPETIRAIGAMGITTAGYWIDDPLDHQRSLVNAGAYQHYFTNDADSVARYQAAGLRSVYHLASSADSEMFHPLPADVTYFADVVFVGTHSPYRESIVAELQDLDLRVYGPGWRKSKLKKSCIHPPAFGAKTNEVYNRARINLNVHAWFGKGSAMNLRLFEVPAAGAFLLTDWVAEIDQAYVEGEHLACFRDAEEMRAKVEHYLMHDAERRAIARKGREHFLRHHSYAARAQQLLATIASGRL